MVAIRIPALTALATSFALAFFPASALAGTFGVMSYNVRGLPPLVIENRTEQIAAIAPLLEDFHTPAASYAGIPSLVGLQELFYQPYYSTLTDPQTVSYPHVTVKNAGGPAGIGDGLTMLSDFEIELFAHVGWDLCFGTLGYFGSDCDTTKGFSYSSVTLEQGLQVDVYVLHADAGQDFGSRTARRDNIRQILESINQLSPAGTAVIVLGDTNSMYTRVGDDNIQDMLADAGLSDAWIELRRDGIVPGAGPDIENGCPSDPGGADCELVDKVFYRSGDVLRLEPESYSVLSEMFSDEAADELSDHSPVAVVFDYERIPSCGDATNDGDITVADALKVLRIAVGSGTCPTPIEICDYTGDSDTTASDALAILRFAVGQDIAPMCPDASLGTLATSEAHP